MRETTCVSHQSNGFTKLYLETAEKDKPLPVLKNDQMLLFIKYFDVKQQKLRCEKIIRDVKITEINANYNRGLGHIFVSLNDKVSSVLSNLLEKAGLPKSTSIQLYEEVKPTSIDLLKGDQTFRKAEIQHGDILCFQQTLSQRE